MGITDRAPPTTAAGRWMGWLGPRLALASVYVLAARLGFALGAVSGFAMPVWPPAGIALAALVLFGERLWPGVAAGAFLANVGAGAPWPAAIGIAVGNTLEAVIGARVLHARCGLRATPERLREVVDLIVFAALLSTTASATLGVASLRVAGVVEPGRVAATWGAWWLGDALGDLVVAPFLIALADARHGAFPRGRRALEAAALAVTVAATSLFVFFGEALWPRVGTIALPHWCFPALIWAALRFGVAGAALGTFAVSAIAIAGTALGFGPFQAASVTQRLTSLQSFTAVLAVAVLLLGAAVSERERAARLRDELLATVSHDLKNPLGVLRLTLQQMRRAAARGAGPDPPARTIDVLMRATDRMDHLIRDLLDRAAIDAGRLAVAVAPHDAGALVDESLQMMAPAATERGVSLRARPPREPIAVTCDRERVLQVLANLVGNAIKFSPPGSEVTVAVDRTDAGEARFAVIDAGPGLAPEACRHVFERGWQEPGTARLGSGLGLYIAKGIVEAHRGRLEVESEVGRGCTFRFTLPAPVRAAPRAR